MRPRQGLDRQRVIDAAAALADERGFEHLSLGELAKRLGVRSPSLYNHVAGLPAVRRELALRGRRELAARLARAAAGKSAENAVRTAGHAYRAYALEHPGLYAALQAAPDPSDSELVAASAEPVEVVVAVLAGIGLDDAQAIHAVRALRSILHGFVALEAAGAFGLPVNLDDSFDNALDIFIAGLRHSVRSAGGRIAEERRKPDDWVAQ